MLDNLREGVLVPDIYDPDLNPLYRDVLAQVRVIWASEPPFFHTKHPPRTVSTVKYSSSSLECRVPEPI
ncbi:MAG: hypothetical protein WBQ46_00360 [Terriglobales bacterium]